MKYLFDLGRNNMLVLNFMHFSSDVAIYFIILFSLQANSLAIISVQLSSLLILF